MIFHFLNKLHFVHHFQRNLTSFEGFLTGDQPVPRIYISPDRKTEKVFNPILGRRYKKRAVRNTVHAERWVWKLWTVTFRVKPQQTSVSRHWRAAHGTDVTAQIVGRGDARLPNPTI
jgi:hypothetical protein